jgi:hypothetical protein
MARTLRVKYVGAPCRVMNRCDRREAIFNGKVALAVRLREGTPVTVKWIAERLQMGSPGYVNYLLYQRRKAGKK